MPCNCDYMEPSKAEKDSKETANLLVFVLTSLNEEVPAWVKDVVDSTYGNPSKLNDLVVLLCEKLTSIDNTDVGNAIIYDGRNKTSRRLADWWERHVEADKKRIAREKEKVDRKIKREYAKYLELKKKFEE